MSPTTATHRGDGLDELDPRVPIRSDHPIQTFATLLREWDNRDTVINQTERATEQARVPEERFIQPAPETLTLRAIEAPAPYPALTEPELAHDFATQPGSVTQWYALPEVDD